MIPNEGFEILRVEAAHFARFNAGLGEAQSNMRFVRHGAACAIGLAGTGTANFKAHARPILRHGSIERSRRMNEHRGCAAHARG